MNKPRILFYDVETSPILGYTFGIYDTNVAHVVRDTHLMSFAWKWSDEKTISQLQVSIKGLNVTIVVGSQWVKQTY